MNRRRARAEIGRENGRMRAAAEPPAALAWPTLGRIPSATRGTTIGGAIQPSAAIFVAGTA